MGYNSSFHLATLGYRVFSQCAHPAFRPNTLFLIITQLPQISFGQNKSFFDLLMEFNNLNFHQLADNGPNFKNNHWWSQLLTFCKTLDPCWESRRG
ncbi:hypothetical protein Hanom_Chr17g01561001 [Helianthus anomalus]